MLSIIHRKTINFCDITPCSPLSTDVSEEHIASIFRVEEISSARNQQASRWLATQQMTLHGLHRVISQKSILFITTDVKTSKPTVIHI
jgi:hypothetical protein